MAAYYSQKLVDSQEHALGTLTCAYVDGSWPAFRNNRKLAGILREMRRRLLRSPAVAEVDLRLVPRADDPQWYDAVAAARQKARTAFRQTTGKRRVHLIPREIEGAKVVGLIPRRGDDKEGTGGAGSGLLWVAVLSGLAYALL